MLKPLYALLQKAIALLVALTDDEVRSYLAASAFPLDQLSQGTPLVERAKASLARSEEGRIRSRGTTEAVERSFASLFGAVTLFRFVALRAFEARADLIQALGLAPRAPRKKAAPPVEGQPAPEPGEERLAPGRDRRIDRFLMGAASLLRAVLADEEALALLVPFGCGRERIESLLAHAVRLGEDDQAQEGVKDAFHAATAGIEEEYRALRRWTTPWRRMVRKALVGRPDLMKRIGVA